MDAPDDVRGRSPVVAGIAQRKPLIERGVGPRHRAMVLEISSNRVAKPPSIAEVPGQLAERRRVVHTVKSRCLDRRVGCVAPRLPPQATPPATVLSRPKSSTALTKRQPEWCDPYMCAAGWCSLQTQSPVLMGLQPGETSVTAFSPTVTPISVTCT